MTEAKNSGIHVVGRDSATNAADEKSDKSRCQLLIIRCTSITEVGQTLMDAVKDIADGEGKWATPFFNAVKK